MEYQQPLFYHFNEDSIRLVDWVIKQKHAAQSILDIGAGCGVIAIEYLLKKKSEVLELTFIEEQNQFLEHIHKNMNTFLPKQKYKIENSKLDYNRSEKKYDLVLSNPPYFREGEGRVSQSKEKQKCRTFQDENLIEWFKKSLSYLSKEGSFYFLAHKSNRDMDEIIKLGGQVETECGDVYILKALKK